MNTRLLALALVLIAALCPVSVLLADDKAADEPKEPVLVFHSYDIAAYLQPDRQYNFAFIDLPALRQTSYCGGAGGSLGGGLSSNGQPDVETDKGRQLQELIERLVHPEDAWESMGGRSALVISYEAGTLLVTTTEAAHKQLAELLATAAVPRESLAVQVQVVELTDKAAPKMFAGPTIARTEAEKKALAESIATVHASTTLTGRNGQVLSNNVGTSGFILGVIPVVAEGAVSFDSNLTPYLDGFGVRCQSTLLADRKRVLVDYRFLLARLLQMEQSAVGGAAVAAAETKIDKPVMLCDQRAGTITLSLDAPTVVAAGLVPARLVSAKAAADQKVQLYYIITVQWLDGAAPAAAETKPQVQKK